MMVNVTMKCSAAAIILFRSFFSRNRRTQAFSYHRDCTKPIAITPSITCAAKSAKLMVSDRLPTSSNLLRLSSSQSQPETTAPVTPNPAATLLSVSGRAGARI